MPKLNIENFRGGLSLVEPFNIEDNQFEVLKNFSYNKDKRVQTRFGVTTFGNSIGSAPITSYFFFQNDTTAERIALCTAGTEMYKYNEGTSNWDSIKTGLTEFETDGVTRTRWSFAVYLNKIYMCNGVDAYAEYDGTTYTELGAQPKCRYLRYMADSIYGAGEDTNPSTIYATTAGAGDGRTLNANDIKVGGDELGRINGFLDLGNLLLVFKDRKIYNVSGDLASAQPIDAQNGGYCHRALKNVENAIFYYSESGIDRVKPRSGVAGASSLSSEPVSDDLRALLDKVTPKQRNNGAGLYNDFLNNYYFSFDTGNDSVPDSTLIYSSLVGGWSEYVIPAIYDYGIYIDQDGNQKILGASAVGGQMYELETGFQDFGAGIPTELKTKKWDLGDVGLYKTYQSIDITGLKNEGSEIGVEILIDDEVYVSATINDSFINVTSGSITLGSTPIGLNPIGGGAGTSTDIELYRYLIRIPIEGSGSNIQVRMLSESNPNVYTLDKITMNFETESMDLFSVANIG